MTKIPLDFGCWPSLLSAKMVAGKSVRFGKVQAVGEFVYWSESRPAEKGRSVLMKARVAQGGDPQSAFLVQDVLPEGFSAHSRVHEYGGGEFLAQGNGVYFINESDQDVYLLEEEPLSDGRPEDRAPRRVTHLPDTRFADLEGDAKNQRLIAVAEHHGKSEVPPQNFLAGIALKTAAVTKVSQLCTRHDFYASPRLSPDLKYLAWLAWDLPHMPWEAAVLYVASVAKDGSLQDVQKIAGGPHAACFQPEWTNEGQLLFVCEKTGWNNLYSWSPNTEDRAADGAQPLALWPLEADFGQPMWVLHMRSFAILSDQRIAVRYIRSGAVRLGILEPKANRLTDIETPFADITEVVASGRHIIGIAAADDRSSGLVAITLPPLGKPDAPVQAPRYLRASELPPLSQDDISRARILSFSGHIKEQPRQVAFGLYYPPASATYTGPKTTGTKASLPPVIIRAHGGPSAMADRGFHPKVQFWTSRGFAVFDVDYAGSTGYGRAYRERLCGAWGRRDVDDILAGAEYLIAEGLADPARMVVSGGSAGGFTALMALSKSDLFAAGTSYYAVTDMERLSQHMHKFEAGYIATLTGVDLDKNPDGFRALSPIHYVDQIKSPVLFFQGLRDTVVPPEQTRQIATSLRAANVPVAIYEFPAEGHGFRQAETIVSVLSLEYAFYAKVFGLVPGEKTPQIQLSNAGNITA